MGDKEVAYALLGLNLFKHVEDMGLNRNIKSRSRFVKHDVIRFEQENSAEVKALELT